MPVPPCGAEYAAICPCLSESAKLKFMKHCASNESDCGLIPGGKILRFIITEFHESLIREGDIASIKLVKLVNRNARGKAFKTFLFEYPEHIILRRHYHNKSG